MSFTGTVRNGVVVLPPEAKLPEGTRVEVIADQEREPAPLLQSGSGFRDHRAFLTSYAPEDEGLYDDAQAR